MNSTLSSKTLLLPKSINSRFFFLTYGYKKCKKPENKSNFSSLRLRKMLGYGMEKPSP